MSKAKKPRTAPSWSTIKSRLNALDRAGLLGLIQDLYGLNRANQAFLHARLELGGDALAPYKKSMHRWLYPDAMRNEHESVAKAKATLSEYRKAIGRPEGMLDLHVFWCETAAAFSMDYGYANEGYFNALLRQFEAALKTLASVDTALRAKAVARLVAVYSRTDVGYGVRDEMSSLLDQAHIRP